MRTYQICQMDGASSHWLRSGLIQRRGASQVYVELRFTMIECSSRVTHHRSCKETFNLFYYQADTDEATPTHPSWMENPYTKVHSYCTHTHINSQQQNPPRWREPIHHGQQLYTC